MKVYAKLLFDLYKTHIKSILMFYFDFMKTFFFQTDSFFLIYKIPKILLPTESFVTGGPMTAVVILGCHIKTKSHNRISEFWDKVVSVAEFEIKFSQKDLNPH